MKNVFSRNIEFILKNSMSSIALAEISGVKQPTLWRIASGISKKPYERTRRKIADALNVKLDILDNKLLNSDDLKEIQISPKNIYTLQWHSNSDSDINLYKNYFYKLTKPSFFLDVDTPHATSLTPLNSKLEFKCDIVCEDDIIAVMDDSKAIELYIVTRVKKEHYLVTPLSKKDNFQVMHRDVMGVLKNIHL
jgi:transcriptional regulator with XRE-family HTH domain